MSCSHSKRCTDAGGRDSQHLLCTGELCKDSVDLTQRGTAPVECAPKTSVFQCKKSFFIVFFV